MDPVDLDERLDVELRRLPTPQAPLTLLPRVLTATVDGGGRAAATGWLTWSPAARFAAVVAMLALVAGATMLATAPPRGVAEAAQTAGEVATVARVLWDVMLQPVATYLFVLGVSLALACALAWAALEAALGGASQR